MTTRVSPRQQGRSLVEEIGLKPADIKWRKKFLEFGDDDVQRIVKHQDLLKKLMPDVISEFYDHLLSFAETKGFFDNPEVLRHVKQAQGQYFQQLVEGHYEDNYIEGRLNVGKVHARIGVTPDIYLGAYRRYLNSLFCRLLDSPALEKQKGIETALSLMKLIFLDMGLAIDSYIDNYVKTIRLQTEAIRELSTPVLQLRDGLLILPIIGVIDSERANQLTETLLCKIHESDARVVIIDVTGVPAVDSNVAAHLMQTVHAAALMGATSIISGISAAIAQTLVHLGIDLGSIRTVSNLQRGIEVAEQYLHQSALDGDISSANTPESVS
ncbi:MAG: STAS domain-containing protein [Candidatus Melainabacteria bacterium]|nr:STAS domain-containing protein [Candidatus Melainabacteria bacterium]